jgi:NADH:ubiquinone oxidoreductase 24 kD subunit
MSVSKKQPEGCHECDGGKYGEIASIIDLYRDKEGSLIKVLHLAQEMYGYLPLDLQRFIAEGMGKPLSEVSGVVTFYSFFPQSRAASIPSACAWAPPAMCAAAKKL